MTEIKIKQLIFTNFKGIRSLTVDFYEETSISGDNGTGKTSIADGYYWLLFDKDSTDRKDFNIKTLDENNKPLPGLDHSVEGKFDINGKVKTFKKTYREKWIKKRGEAEAVFTGHETIYEINDVPVSQSAYNEQIREVSQDEKIFKMLSNILYFNQGISGQDRRKVLMGMNGTITPDVVINYEPSLYPLRELLQDTTLDKLKEKISKSIKKLNTEIASIPFRIDECNKAINKDIDFLVTKNEIAKKKKNLKSIDEQLQSVTAIDPSRVKTLEEISSLKTKISLLEITVRNEKSEKERELKNSISQNENKIKSEQTKIDNNKKQITNYDSELTKLNARLEKHRADFKATQEKQFVIDDNFICPTCKRPLDADVVEKKKNQMEENFNNDKAEKLKAINEFGKQAKEQIKNIEELRTSLVTANEEAEILITGYKESNWKFREELETLQTTPLNYGYEHSELTEKVKALEATLTEPTDRKTETKELKEQKEELEKVIENLNKDLAKEDSNKELEKRIMQLSAKERQLAEQIADLQRQQFLCEKYVMTEVELFESEINAKFSFVKWRLFDKQINGGIKECCDALINGVPFADANTASKINAGLDVINTLSQQYNVSVPVWIDNRESVVRLIETNSQIINLSVVKDQPLVIS